MTDAHAGVFDGYLISRWRIPKKKDELRTDDTDAGFSDWYANNQYIGTWTANGATTSRTANWGDARIPASGDLDIGAGEFGPNPKYETRGWANYHE